MTATPADSEALARAAGLLACPECRAPLGVDPDWIRCESCDARFPIEDGVPRLALHGTSETWGEPQAARQSGAYQSEFRQLEPAAAYNRQFQRRILKLGVTPRETALIRRYLRRAGPSSVLLELPCGGGRLTPALADFTDFIVAADIAPGQIEYGRRHSKIAVPRVWITASAFHIPLRDSSVDGAVCVRLLHHLPTESERERLFAELMRVSRRFVILTYFDRHSLKYLTWRLRHPFSRKPRKPASTRGEVAALARRFGARLVKATPLSVIGSGHRYAFLVKDSGAG